MSKLAPLANQIDQQNVAPREIWKQMGEMGLLGVTAPTQFGGLQLGYLENCIVTEELSRASASVGLSYTAHSNLCVNQIVRNGTPEQQKRYLPKLISGEHVGALCISEEEAGSDAVALKTTATKKGDKYLLNGSKMWITNGDIADVCVVYAKTHPEKGRHGITAFIVETKTKGFSANPPMEKLGMRGSHTSQLFFEDVAVPEENVLGGEDKGVRVLMSGLDLERLVLSAGPVGIMQACIDTVLPYVVTRKQFRKPLSSFQFTQGKLADLYTSLAASRAYMYNVARAVDENRIDTSSLTRDAAAVFLFTAENAVRSALQAIQCLGGSGYTTEYPTGRLLRDAKLYEIGGGTTEIRRIVVGRELARSLADQ
eukprot:TRINITY_DN5403_c0_g1_i1.p1 TRINITY_DN5403_c0_g1~~TRINITY_DN5403_c0_g1_i1.p1  ORF type:complete len:369 (-),score=92.15 TRINITY_DN5403_c0_g1_i1:175-1281(-)